MQHRWLTFLSIGFLGVVVFIFFWYRNQPIEIPELDTIQIGSVTQPSVTYVNPSKGALEPTVTIIEFGDFQCTACQTLATSLDVVLKTYPDDVKLVWKDLPNESSHEMATPAAIAAHCADRQGAFWEYHDALFAQQNYLSETRFGQIALEVGLDTEEFASCYDSRDTLPIVKKDYEEGIALGLTSTPTLYLDSQLFVGALSTQELIDLVSTLLKTP
jgi:protein-disulfide isomerase